MQPRHHLPVVGRELFMPSRSHRVSVNIMYQYQYQHILKLIRAAQLDWEKSKHIPSAKQSTTAKAINIFQGHYRLRLKGVKKIDEF